MTAQTENNNNNNNNNKRRNRAKNPLYVVTEKGKTVQAATGPWDAIIKRFGMAPYLQMLQDFLNFILKNLVAHAGVDKVLGQVQAWLGQFETLLRQLMPFAFFYR
jgi:hypothetical protein